MDEKGKKEVRNIMDGIMADTLSRPFKKHPQSCRCDPCLISIKRRALRAEAIKRKEDNK